MDKKMPPIQKKIITLMFHTIEHNEHAVCCCDCYQSCLKMDSDLFGRRVCLLNIQFIDNHYFGKTEFRSKIK